MNGLRCDVGCVINHGDVCLRSWKWSVIQEINLGLLNVIIPLRIRLKQININTKILDHKIEMELQELQILINKDLDSRNLKNPNIRKNALRKIVKFISETYSHINQETLSLPNRNNLVKNYEIYKSNNINGAEKHIIKLIYDYYIVSVGRPIQPKIPNAVNHTLSNCSESGNKSDFIEIEQKLIKGNYKSVDELQKELLIPESPGIYCIKLKEGVSLPEPYSHKLTMSRIIYIGISSVSLKDRLWEQELQHSSPATFFRSMGAILGYLPESGSLYGIKTKNYKFSTTDTEKIKNWMRESLEVNFLSISASLLDNFEKRLITKYTPLVNIKDNPFKCKELENARKRCVEIAKSKPMFK